MKRVPLLILFPVLAMSHPMPGVGDFYAGMLHPVMALDQLLVLLGLCVLAAQSGKSAARRLIVSLPIAVIAGVPLAAVLYTIPHFAVIPLAATAALGLMAALAKPAAHAAIVPLGVLAGIWMGAANAIEGGASISMARFTAGMAVSVLLFSAYVAVALQRFVALRAPVVMRVAGSWLAAIATMAIALK